MTAFTFDDMRKIDRKTLGGEVPLELFRTIRLIGLHQGLPMGGKATTLTVGRKIGDSLPVRSVDDILKIFVDLKIGLPKVIHQDPDLVRVVVEDCFCDGLPASGTSVCDLEGAILEGAMAKVTGKTVRVRETKCNVAGHEHCEYEIRIGG
ncbi:V4R domain-containing protein [Novispirillum itersonii]|uniref:Putative hydrocarbon binding protein n=1 Tax=Novispirillum itersonii TaxID=189 RepID=A0A7X0DLC4_NOVIT|nr:V4R domain-containing protein [Novispirillum itersonii]MBB6209883.1 putative hydrocarbon binding protein [Novispirillum itersonii]